MALSFYSTGLSVYVHKRLSEFLPQPLYIDLPLYCLCACVCTCSDSIPRWIHVQIQIADPYSGLCFEEAVECDPEKIGV